MYTQILLYQFFDPRFHFAGRRHEIQAENRRPAAGDLRRQNMTVEHEELFSFTFFVKLVSAYKN